MIKYAHNIDGVLMPSNRGDWVRVADFNIALNQEMQKMAHSQAAELEAMRIKLANWRLVAGVCIIVALTSFL